MSSFSKRASCVFFILIFLVSVVGAAAVGGVSGWMVAKNIKVDSANNGFNLGGTQIVKVQEDSAYIDAVAKVSPAVVSITLTKDVQSFFGDYTQTGGGTGFVINSDGLILTNKHVVSEKNANYTAITADGKKYDIKSMSLDPVGDLAIVKIEADGLPVVDLADSNELKIGQRVIAIGNALNEYQNTVTTGIVSAVDRTVVAGDGTSGSSEQLENMIQTDAAINLGNSGGPLLDISGRVIGINTAIDSQASSIGFAIPINQAKSAIESYLKSGQIVRPRLGVRYLPLTPEVAALNQLDVTDGALIYAGSNLGELPVVPGGPADKAGLQANDIIVSINGEKISENHSLSGLLQQYKPGDEVEIEYIRKGEKNKTKVILDEMK